MNKDSENSLVAFTNKVISQGFGLSESLDFVNNAEDMRTVEEIIEKKGLTDNYLTALRNTDTTARTRQLSLEEYKIERLSLRARAAKKMIDDGIIS